jgi:hypothetical protein
MAEVCKLSYPIKDEKNEENIQQKKNKLSNVFKIKRIKSMFRCKDCFSFVIPTNTEIKNSKRGASVEGTCFLTKEKVNKNKWACDDFEE